MERLRARLSPASALRWSHRSPGRNHIIYNQNPSSQWRTDYIATLTMILGFLAVEGIGDVQAMIVCQGNCGGSSQWYAFIGWPKNHVAFDT